MAVCFVEPVSLHRLYIVLPCIGLRWFAVVVVILVERPCLFMSFVDVWYAVRFGNCQGALRFALWRSIKQSKSKQWQ